MIRNQAGVLAEPDSSAAVSYRRSVCPRAAKEITSVVVEPEPVIERHPLLTLLALIDRMPLPPRPRGRGHPYVYDERLVLKALVVLQVRHVRSPHGLLAMLAEPTAEVRAVRAQVTDAQGRCPCRRTRERRLAASADLRPRCGRGVRVERRRRLGGSRERPVDLEHVPLGRQDVAGAGRDPGGVVTRNPSCYRCGQMSQIPCRT